MSVLLGCIADDFTGATDLCATLAGGGMRVVQWLGLPEDSMSLPPDVDALVIALKTRTIDPAMAVEQSSAALEWLRKGGIERFFFKYCSTFDSTPHGNIGPVALALLEALHGQTALACPAFPDNGRTVYQGHLFVGSKLLSESGMEHHPLNPMTDANLVRVLQRQARDRQGSEVYVGLLPLEIVRRGVENVRRQIRHLAGQGNCLIIADAVSNADLNVLGEACADMRLITGGSGMALGLPKAYRKLGLLNLQPDNNKMPRVKGYSAVLAGSCSAATLRQIRHACESWPAFELPVERVAAGKFDQAETLAWAARHLPASPVLVFSSADNESVTAIQSRFGRDRAGTAIERTLATVAEGLVQLGVRRLIVAGGETSGAVVSALGVKSLRIGPQIDPGVPWTETLSEPTLALALKSGNFGGDDFFKKALEMFHE